MPELLNYPLHPMPARPRAGLVFPKLTGEKKC